MIVRRIVRALRASTAAGWDAWAAESALGNVEGFAEAWRLTEAVPGWLNETNAAIFWGVVAELAPKTIVEIGSYQGRSTVLLALGLRRFGDEQGRVIAIDPHTGDRQHLEQLGLTHLPSLDLFKLHIEGAGVADFVDLKAVTSDEAATGWTEPIDLLYVDGWHSYDAVYHDACNFASKLTRNGVVCFDDYAKYDDVKSAVDDACKKLALNFYGVTVAQAWAGFSPVPPRSVANVLRLSTVQDWRLRRRNRLNGVREDGYRGEY